MALATLSIDLVAKIAKFEDDMGKAARAGEKTAQRINAAMSTMQATLAPLAAGISVAGLVNLAKSAIDSVDALNDLKDATGASIENISALEDVAARTGTSWDTASAGLIKFNSILNNAKPGSDAAKSLEQLGLSVEDLKRLDPAEAMRQTAVALSGLSDEVARGRVVEDLFGKSTREVAAFLKDLGEQGKLVATVTTQQAEEAEKFNKQLLSLQKNAQDASRSLATSLLPTLIETSREMAAGLKVSGGLFDATLAIGTSNPFATAHQNLIDYKQDLADLQEQRKNMTAVEAAVLGKATDLAIEQARKRVAYYKELDDMTAPYVGNAGRGKVNPDLRLTSNAEFEKYLENLQKQIEKTQELTAVQQIGMDINAGRLGALTTQQQQSLIDAAMRLDKLKKANEKPLKAPQSDFSKYLENLQKALEKNQELTTVQQLGYDINAGRLGKMSTAQQNELVSLAQKVDITKAQTEAEKELSKALAERLMAEQDTIKQLDDEFAAIISQLTANTPTVKFKQQQDDLAALQEAYAQGQISEQVYAEAVAERFDLNNEKIKETKSLAEELGLTFTSAAEDAIVNWKGLSDVLAGLEQDILRIVTRKVITEPLGNYISSSLGSLGKAVGLSSLFSFDGGGYTGSGSRSGGLDGKGGFLAVMHPQETVTDHTKGQSAGGGTSVVNNYNFTVGDVASVTTVKQAIAASERRIAATYNRSNTYGG
ncbi:hypothetical protein [Rhodoferax sp. BLA1]|uniref:hypothetical protein n=1 Tax=Rhodoferax sp. BLA1 TaxID=2576062 RepID=UPI0015D17963|nr:hypothetical protein [Rhodoferax sp. BLA1]